MGAAPSDAALAILEGALSKATPPRSPKIAAAFAVALAVAVIGPITIYTVVKDPPMTASELIILRALIDKAAEKTDQAGEGVWRELHRHGVDQVTPAFTRTQWTVAVKYLVTRIGVD